MASAIEQLPDFDNPPVVEVVAGVQFDPLRLESAWIGMWWDRIREKFPHTEDKPPLEKRTESFGQAGPPRIRLELVSETPRPRVWFSDKDDPAELLQLQDDRFIFNWRGHQDDSPYPRYGHVRSEFIRLYKEFEEFLSENQLNTIKPNQCELTYINYIRNDKEWNSLKDLGGIFNFWGNTCPPLPDQQLEQAECRLSYQLLNSDGEPFGRMQIFTAPRLLIKSGETLIQFELSVKGFPATSDLDSVIQFFDTARENIVKSFASLTTQKMHSIWRRKDVT